MKPSWSMAHSMSCGPPKARGPPGQPGQRSSAWREPDAPSAGDLDPLDPGGQGGGPAVVQTADQRVGAPSQAESSSRCGHWESAPKRTPPSRGAEAAPGQPWGRRPRRTAPKSVPRRRPDERHQSVTSSTDVKTHRHRRRALVLVGRRRADDQRTLALVAERAPGGPRRGRAGSAQGLQAGAVVPGGGEVRREGRGARPGGEAARSTLAPTSDPSVAVIREIDEVWPSERRGVRLHVTRLPGDAARLPPACSTVRAGQRS